MVDPARVRRLAAVWLVVLALVATGSCSWPGSNEPEAPLLVSYSGATGQLAALDEFEGKEQLRDWARLGLASALRLDRDRIVDALYDTTPIRDPAFADLVEQPTGPGRGLFDGTTLHVLVPQDDPHRSRTIGLLVDEHRAGAGADPAQVQVHRYQVRPERKDVELVAEPATATSKVRAGNGWHEARVDQPGGLVDFLAATDHLSRLETRGAEVWAAGWRWPDTPGAAVTAEDVAVLQRGYQQTSGPLPGFSLDPEPRFSQDPTPPPTLGDVRATIPGLDPALADRIISGNWAGSGYASAGELAALVEGALAANPPSTGPPQAPGLPADRTQLWALLNLLEGRPVYSQARYDGGLEGTEVGMTLFYADLVAKDWTAGVGSGVPSAREVPGFLPDSQAVTPPGLCPPPGESHSESGRLWFGQNDTAFAVEPNGISVGAQATRLFARSDGPGGTEVETSYRFGRSLRWWDQHYQAIADYEPQYHRLEQLMRWSGALEWLTTKGSGELPAVADSEIRSDLRFADWYAGYDALRERARPRLVTPPSARQESVLPVPSATTKDCGYLQIIGGVSLADGLTRSRSLPSATDALPPWAGRGGFTDPTTTAINPSGSGRIDRVTVDTTGQVTDRVTHVLQRGPDSASMETVRSSRGEIPIGEARLKGETEQHALTIEVRSEGPDLTFDTAYADAQAATVRATKPPSSGVSQVDITVYTGVLGYLREAITRVRQDPVHGLDNAPGVLYHYLGPEGQTIARYDAGWLELGTGPTSSRTFLATDVATPVGVRELRVVAPAHLSKADLDALVVTQEAAVARYHDLLTTIPPDTPIYLDIGSLVGPEAAGGLAAAIPADALVSFRPARPARDPTSPGQISPGPWSLVDRTGSGRGGPGGPGVPGGGGPSGGAAGAGIDGGFNGQVVLVTVCGPETPPEQQENEECG